MKPVLMVVALAVGLCSCTNQQIYNSTQISQKNECEKLQTVQRDECMKRLGPDYEKYEAERKKLLKKNE
jgi:uncharacterized FlgJ-related protein